MGFDPDQVAWGEQQLADWAAQFGPRDLRRLAEQIVGGIDPDGTLPDEKLQQDRRHFTLHPTRDGGYAGEFRLTAQAGVKLQAVLGPLAKQQVNTVETADGKPVEEPDARTYGQRMHDALEQVCDRLLRCDSMPDAGGTPATVIITLDLQDLLDKTGYAVTSDGTLIPTEKALRAGRTQAEMYFAAVTAKGEVLRLGRSRRIATRSQTIALIARDKGCSFPGCDTAPEWTERHHVIAVERGRADRSGQSDPALSLPPPQLPRQRLGLHDQPRRATRMATTLVGRPRPQTDDQQPHPHRPRRPDHRRQ